MRLPCNLQICWLVRTGPGRVCERPGSAVCSCCSSDKCCLDDGFNQAVAVTTAGHPPAVLSISTLRSAEHSCRQNRPLIADRMLRRVEGAPARANSQGPAAARPWWRARPLAESFRHTPDGAPAAHHACLLALPTGASSIPRTL